MIFKRLSIKQMTQFLFRRREPHFKIKLMMKVTQKVIPNFRGHTSLDIKSEVTIKEKSLLANQLSAIFIYSFTYLFLIYIISTF